MAKGVQFRGIPAIMKAYDNCKIIAWAILYDKGINMKYQGGSEAEARETLNVFLNDLDHSGTTAVYTLNLYEGLAKNQKIKSSLEPDYSFNFCLQDESDPRGFYYQRNTQLNLLVEKVTALEARLAMKEQEEAEEEGEGEEPGSLGAVLSGLLSDERVKDWIRTKAIGWADKFLTPPALPGSPGAVIPMGGNNPAAVGGITNEDPILINEEQQKKMQQAIEILARCDPSLGDNLLKLAKIAENDPGKYSSLKNFL